MAKPVIGITIGSSSQWLQPEGFYRPYREAIEQAGGIPLRLGPEELTREGRFDEDRCQQFLGQIQGLLLTGGADIQPEYCRYVDLSLDSLGPEDRAEQLKRFRLQSDPLRDLYEIPIARSALQRGIPILGICRGFQLLNVLLGGALYADLREGLGTPLRHWSFEGQESRPSAWHLVQIREDSQLSEVLGVSGEEPTNSRHHQGLTGKELAEGLCITALAPDGVVEAFEAEKGGPLLAVQWHPERPEDAYVYQRDQRLFSAFLRWCQEV
jgi:putative glutamine amidotransferase